MATHLREHLLFRSFFNSTFDFFFSFDFVLIILFNFSTYSIDESFMFVFALSFCPPSIVRHINTHPCAVMAQWAEQDCHVDAVRMLLMQTKICFVHIYLPSTKNSDFDMERAWNLAEQVTNIRIVRSFASIFLFLFPFDLYIFLAVCFW